MKGSQVFNAFANAYEADRYAEFSGDGEKYPAFGRAVELGDREAGQAQCLVKLLCLLQRILTKTGIHDQ